MIQTYQNVIHSNLPSILQAATLLAMVTPVISGKHDFADRYVLRRKINIWLRNNKGEDIAVNNDLVDAAGISRCNFMGLTYDRSGLDPQLIEQRNADDSLVIATRAPIIVRESSRFGIVDTMTAPVMLSDGTVNGTLHISSVLSDPLQCCKTSLQKSPVAFLPATVRTILRNR